MIRTVIIEVLLLLSAFRVLVSVQLLVNKMDKYKKIQFTNHDA